MTTDTDVWGPPRAFLAYDLPAESRYSHAPGGSTQDARKAKELLSQRMSIYYQLKVNFRMTAAQQSLWSVRDESTLPLLEAKMAEWLAWYEAHQHMGARMRIIRIRGDAAAEETFEQWELTCLREWLGNLLESCSKIEEKGQCAAKHLRQMETKFGLLASVLQEDFGRSEHWAEIQDELQSVTDALRQCKRLAA